MADQRIAPSVRISDATTLGQQLAVDASGRITVASIATSVTPGTAAANLGKAEDAAHSTGDTGVMALAVRQDTAASLAGADGDYIPLITDSSGRLHVNVGTIVPGTAATSLGKAEDAPHASGDTGVMSLAVRNDTHTTALSGTDGDYTPIAVDSTGKVGIRGTFAEDVAHTSGDLGHFILAVRNDTHTAALSSTDADYTPIAVDASGKVGIRGTFAEDAAHTSGDLGVVSLCVRQDTATQLAGTDGDYSILVNDSLGRLHTNVGVVVPGTAATNLGKAEDAGHTTGDTGVMILGVRNDSNATLAGTDLDYTPLAVDAAGNLQVDVLSGGGSTVPTNAATDITNLTTPINLAAGASGNADTADLASKYLWQVVVSGSIAFKVVIATLSNGTATNKAVFFGGPNNPVVWNPRAGFLQSGSTAGADGFRAAITNLDTTETADFYASFFYADNIG